MNSGTEKRLSVEKMENDLNNKHVKMCERMYYWVNNSVHS